MLKQHHDSGLYQLLLSLETRPKDLLHVLELVTIKKPVSSLDFCYAGESDTITVQECISICSMVAAYDAGTTRANEMLISKLVNMTLYKLTVYV